jgi:hypothetical protein
VSFFINWAMSLVRYRIGRFATRRPNAASFDVTATVRTS